MFRSALCFALLAFVFGMVLNAYFYLDFNLHFFQHHPGVCKAIKAVGFGSEDFEIISSGLVFISSGLASKISSPAFLEFQKKNNIKGRIQLMNLTSPDVSIKELKIKPSASLNLATFRPHGLSILEDKVKGEHLIYVVNHVEEERIEKFKFLPKTGELKHLKSFSSDLLYGINDLAVVSEDKYFVTNSVYFLNQGLLALEHILRLPLTSLAYYNGQEFTIALPDLCGPNGVTVSKDGKYVYVAMFMTKSVRVYERFANNSLNLVQEVYLGTAIDNFHLSEDGSVLYSGNHPILSKLLAHMDDLKLKAPSQILRFPLKNGLIVENEITELFYDHGDLIKASTVGVVYKDKLYIGSFMDAFVVCDLK